MKRLKNQKLFVFLWSISILGALAVLPYIKFLGVVPASFSFTKLFCLTAIQTGVLYAVLCYLSLLLLSKTDLTPFHVTPFSKRIFYPGIAGGVIAGVLTFLLSHALFKNSMLAQGSSPPLWIGLLASFYGAINEEILLRLFFFTLLYFLFKKIFKFQLKNRSTFLWITNGMVAILFGLGHLPVAFKLVEPSVYEVSRILLLNGIPGLVFGWLYWSRGLWAAMVAHFVADLFIHVF